MAVSLPVQIDKVKNARVIPPGIIGLHLPADRSRDRIQLNGQIIDINRLIGAGEDSVLIAIGSTKETDLSLVVDQDTLFVRYPLKQQAAKLGVQFIEKEGLQDRFFISCSDFIQFIDTTKIQLRNMEDSSLVSYSIDYLAHMIELTPKKGCRNLKLVVGEGAIVGLTQNKNAAFQKEIQWKLKREFGDLTMIFSDTIDAGMIQVIQKTEVIRTIEIQRSTKLLVPNLLPGEYTFKILLDRNKNGKWDPVSPETKTLAEEVLLYKAPVKIRANWEIESTFDVRKE
jgi:hypothetical protein